jgi:hypothetical protein
MLRDILAERHDLKEAKQNNSVMERMAVRHKIDAWRIVRTRCH